MIIGNSTDPVFLKKISLKIWQLKDEVNANVEKLINESGINHADAAKAVQEFYSGNGQISAPEADLDSEDEMARALAEAEADSGEDEMAKALAGEIDESDIADAAAPESEEVAAEADVTPIVADATAPNIDLLKAPDLPKDKVHVGRMMLAEIDIEKMFFFCDHRFVQGQSIVIEFEIPKKFILTGTINYCTIFNMKSRVIKKHDLLYRACVDFSFLRKGERTLLREFLESIETKANENGAKAAKKADSDDLLGGDDDDLGLSELDDL